MQITVATNLESLHSLLLEPIKNGLRVGLVPTMGALHAGHIALMQEAKRHCDLLVVSVFVNPTQFGANEDFSKYPRQLEADVNLISQEIGAAIVYAPDAEDMYGAGDHFRISAGSLAQHWCGASRVGHFDGVATVVLKLFNRVMPRVALFGEKDFQQLAIIKALVAQLDLPIEIIGVSTQREADGLAMSSRNVYLSIAERQIAPLLFQTLTQTAEALQSGAGVAQACAQAISFLQSQGFVVEYFGLADEATLAPLSAYQPEARLMVAAELGNTRLIDNIQLR